MRSVTPPRPAADAGGDERPARGTERSSEDRALFERYLDRHDPVDRELLVERFLPLARQLARRYQRPGSRPPSPARAPPPAATSAPRSPSTTSSRSPASGSSRRSTAST